MTPPELRALVADSLALWGVEARVEIAGDGIALATAGDIALAVRPAAEADRPIRWWLERAGRRRPCTGVTGLLRGLRNALGGAGADEGRWLRVAPEA